MDTPTEWRIEVQLRAEQRQALLVEDEDGGFTALDHLTGCDRITQQPDGWIIFAFTLTAADALEATAAAVGRIKGVWDEGMTAPPTRIQELKTEALTLEEWFERVDPAGAARAWAAQDFSKVPMPSVQEQQQMLDLLAEADGSPVGVIDRSLRPEPEEAPMDTPPFRLTRGPVSILGYFVEYGPNHIATVEEIWLQTGHADKTTIKKALTRLMEHDWVTHINRHQVGQVPRYELNPVHTEHARLIVAQRQHRSNRD